MINLIIMDEYREQVLFTTLPQAISSLETCQTDTDLLAWKQNLVSQIIGQDSMSVRVFMEVNKFEHDLNVTD